MKRPDLISRIAAIQMMLAKGKDNLSIATIINELEILPGFEAAPVVYGRWIPTESVVWSNRCSLCKSQARIMHNYCPNCGAKMDRKEKDDD